MQHHTARHTNTSYTDQHFPCNTHDSKPFDVTHSTELAPPLTFPPQPYPAMPSTRQYYKTFPLQHYTTTSLTTPPLINQLSSTHLSLVTPEKLEHVRVALECLELLAKLLQEVTAGPVVVQVLWVGLDGAAQAEHRLLDVLLWGEGRGEGGCWLRLATVTLLFLAIILHLILIIKLSLSSLSLMLLLSLIIKLSISFTIFYLFYPRLVTVTHYRLYH